MMMMVRVSIMTIMATMTTMTVGSLSATAMRGLRLSSPYGLSLAGATTRQFSSASAEPERTYGNLTDEDRIFTNLYG